MTDSERRVGELRFNPRASVGEKKKRQCATPPPLPPEGAGEVKQKAPGEKKRMSKSKIQEKLRKKAGR